MTTTAQAHIADTLQRARPCWDVMLSPDAAADSRRLASNLFIYHVTTAVLLENLRRLDPELADRLTAWLCVDGGIFEDGYAGELLYEWRQQLAAGQPMHPIGPDSEGTGGEALAARLSRLGSSGYVKIQVEGETCTSRPVPDPAPEGFVRVARIEGPDWRIQQGGQCRRTGARGADRCTNRAVAAFNRGQHGRGARVDSWWAYCADHLYGRWVEDGQVMHWVLEPEGAE